MSFIVNTILAVFISVVITLIGIDRFGSLRFAAVMHPLSQAYVFDLMRLKEAHARRIKGPKIVTVSGSSSLHGLRCSVFTEVLNAPCVNGGLPVDLHFDNILEFDRSLMRPGDVALMPIEYIMYFSPTYAGVGRGGHGPRISSLRRINIPDLFRMNFDYLVTSASENVVTRGSGYVFSWEFGDQFFGTTYNFTPEGDRKGHTRELAKQFADRRAKEMFGNAESWPDGSPLPEIRSQFDEFFAWAKQNRILVIGTVQAVYDDWKIPPSWLREIPSIYQNAGFPFFILSNQNRYPRDCFWESSDHLNEECQIINSHRVAEALKPILAERGYNFATAPSASNTDLQAR